MSGASDGRQQIQTSAFNTNSTSSEFILLTRTCQGQLLDDRTCRLQTSTATPLPALSFPFQLFQVQAQCPPTLFHLFRSFQFRLIFINGQSLCFSVFFSIFSVFNFATPVSDKMRRGQLLLCYHGDSFSQKMMVLALQPFEWCAWELHTLHALQNMSKVLDES